MYYLRNKNDLNLANKSINKLFIPNIAAIELEKVKQFIKMNKDIKIATYKDVILGEKYRKRMILAILMAFVFHASLFHILNIYIVKILLSTGCFLEVAKIFAIIASIFDILLVIPMMFFIKNYGRKLLFSIGLLVTIACYISFSIFGYLKVEVIQKYFLVIAKGVLGNFINSIYFAYIGEILPSKGISITQGFFYIFAFAIIQPFPLYGRNNTKL